MFQPVDTVCYIIGNICKSGDALVDGEALFTFINIPIAYHMFPSISTFV
jgi:hypothetical protein